MKRWILGILAAIATLAALLGLRRRDRSAPATGAGTEPIAQQTAEQEAKARAQHEQAKAARAAERAARDEQMRQDAAEEVQRDPVDRANARLRGRQ